MKKEEREVAVIKIIISDYLLSNKMIELENLLLKMKSEGKLIKIIKSFDSIVDYLYEKKGINFGELEVAFDVDKDWIKKKLEEKNFLIKKIKINPDLILGGKFKSKNIEIDFSFFNILKKIFC